MKVLCKSSNQFLIKDEWYEVISTRGYISVIMELVNHTDKRWNTNWYHESNFYTLQELREIKLKQIL